MYHPKILVTAATGKTGSAVVTQLRERDWPVRAVVRTLDQRSARLERLGAEVVVADVYDPDHLLRAMGGTTRAYYCPPMSPFMIQSAAAFAVAAREAKLEAIVGMTQWLASPSHPALLTRQHWLADNLFSTIPGIAYVAINPGYFADNYLTGSLMRFAAHLGIFPWPYGAGKNAPPSNEDIARVAVAALIDPAPHAGRAYRPTGPDLLDGTEMAAILSRVLGRSVRRFDMPESLFLKAIKHAGYPTFVQNEMRRYTLETSDGAWEVDGPTTDVLDLTGRPPESFETIARRYAAAPANARTTGNFLRAVAEFAAVGMTPGENFADYERAHELPSTPEPKFATQDERWLLSHDAERTDPSGIARLRPRDPLAPPAPHAIAGALGALA